jgi:hypothetical protein
MRLPLESDLRRVWPLAEVPKELVGPSLERIAHHEAGHIVMMEWLGVLPAEATATESTGAARFDPEQFDQDEHPTDYDRPLAAAQAASMFHAGIVAELIHAGLPWRGVTIRMQSQDWRHAHRILAPHFGHGLSGHGFSQRTALAVLTHRWARVQEIANQITTSGRWSPNQGE